MQTLKTATLTAFVSILLLAGCASAMASSFSAVISYGDSLSDNGNLFAATGYPPPPYYNGRFSNGPVSIEQLATMLNVPLLDFAYGGATSGLGNDADGGTQSSLGSFGLPGMLVELAKAPVPPGLVTSALFVVWGGANDFITGGSPAIAAANIDTIVATLEAEGATHILVPGLPDLGKTPEFYGVPAASLFTQQFNQDLLAGLPSGATYFDTYAFLNGIVANPAAYGLTNVTGECFNGTTVCPNPGQYLFWDDIHPTTTVDALLAKQFDAVVTPEPSSILLLGTGITGIAARLLRRRKAA